MQQFPPNPILLPNHYPILRFALTCGAFGTSRPQAQANSPQIRPTRKSAKNFVKSFAISKIMRNFAPEIKTDPISVR